MAARLVVTSTSPAAALRPTISPSAAKMARYSHERPARIVTHDGAFHCDDALACFLLSKCRAFADRGVEVVRTRDPVEIESPVTDAVVDVGGVFDASRRRFDHHQRGFAEVFGGSFNTKLSSSGLVYREYGREIIASELGIEETGEECGALYKAIYRSFMESIDAIDNGICQFEGADGLKPRFTLNSSLSSRVGKLNVPWNDEVSTDRNRMRDKQLERFHAAMNLTGAEFFESLRYHKDVWMPAREIVQTAVRGRADVHASGRAVFLGRSCPWKEHLLEIEADEDGIGEGDILYVIYEDDKAQYRIQCVPIAADSFESRHPLPEKWRGVRDEELSGVAGIDGCVFCHASGFIGGNKTYEGALKMVDVALQDS